MRQDILLFVSSHISAVEAVKDAPDIWMPWDAIVPAPDPYQLPVVMVNISAARVAVAVVVGMYDVAKDPSSTCAPQIFTESPIV